MSSLNEATIIGNIGKISEMRVAKNGKAVCTMRVATHDFNGETTWHSVSVWGKDAELCIKYLKVGQQVCVKGEIKNSSWAAEDGSARQSTEIVARRVIFIGNNPEKEEKND